MPPIIIPTGSCLLAVQPGKIAAVHSHLFLPLGGWWGTRPPSTVRFRRGTGDRQDRRPVRRARLAARWRRFPPRPAKAATALASVDGSVPALVTDPDVGDTQAIMVALRRPVGGGKLSGAGGEGLRRPPALQISGLDRYEVGAPIRRSNPTQVAAMAFSYPARTSRRDWSGRCGTARCSRTRAGRMHAPAIRGHRSGVTRRRHHAASPVGARAGYLGGVRRRVAGSTATPTVSPPVANEP